MAEKKLWEDDGKPREDADKSGQERREFADRPVLKEGEGEVDMFQSATADEVGRLMRPDLKNKISKFQAEGKLPESPDVQRVVSGLKQIENYFGVKVEFERESGDKNEIFLPIERFRQLVSQYGCFSADSFKNIFSKGSLYLGALVGTLIPGHVLAQGVELSQAGVEHFHWEDLVTILLLLLSSGVLSAYLIKKIRKSGLDKAVNEAFKAMQKAKSADEKEKAKDKFFDLTMGELPATMAAMKQGAMPKSAAEVKKALKYKKQNDEAIAKFLQELEEKMVFSGFNSLEEADKLKNQVLGMINFQMHKLNLQYQALFQAWQAEQAKFAGGQPGYLANQLEFEKQKIKYMLDYLKFLEKKWLIFVQNEKNKLISASSKDLLTNEDKTKKEILDLKNDLKALMNEQVSLLAVDFAQKLKDLDHKLDEKIEQGKNEGIPEYQEEKEKMVGFDSLALENGGKYDEKTGIKYLLNGVNCSVDLFGGATVEIWVNEQQQIKMNFLYKKVLVESKNLMVGPNGLYLSGGISLKDYILFQKNNQSIQQGVEASAELPLESGEVLNELGGKFANVFDAVKSKKYGFFGQSVLMDDRAIDYHLVRIHREFYEGGEHVAVVFKLGESHWKKALSHLASQADLPKNSVYYNFEGQSGEKADISQSMLRFNVMINGKQVPVMVAASEDYRALFGVVRILFDCKEDFSSADARKVFAEVAQRLDINSHIKPVFSEARQNLQKDLQDISRESVNAADSTKKIHPEYETEVFSVNVEALKEQGLHSIYAQVPLGHLAALVESGQMLSTVRRWSKGLLKHGMSSTADLSCGGAESVFTRIHTKDSAKEAKFYGSNGNKLAIIFPPDLVKRCDRYAYTSDRYGSKVPTTFDQRVSMEQLVKTMKNSYSTSNEVMFYDAISLNDAAYIVSDVPQEVIKVLHEKGVGMIGGKSLGEAVITPEQFKFVTF